MWEGRPPRSHAGELSYLFEAGVALVHLEHGVEASRSRSVEFDVFRQVCRPRRVVKGGKLTLALPQAPSMDLNVSMLPAGVPMLLAGVAALVGATAGAGAAFAADGFEVAASADPVASYFEGFEAPQPILRALGGASSSL